MTLSSIRVAALAALAGLALSPAAAQQNTDGAGGECAALPSHAELTKVLREVVAPGDKKANGGLGNHMWAAVVDRGGVICAVARSGKSFGDQWPGSRAIAAKKAFSANAFSLSNFALSTANLFWPSQPHNSLYGLDNSNPVDTDVLFRGSAAAWGTANDPMVGSTMGGVTLFAGGLALYTAEGKLIGALGLSGDESCTDHVIAWKIRHQLNLDNVPKGVHPEGNDNIIFDLTTDPASGRQKSASGYGHPTCSPGATAIAKDFNRTFPTGPGK